MNGTLKKGEKIKFLQQGTTHEVIELGHFTPKRSPAKSLSRGRWGI